MKLNTIIYTFCSLMTLLVCQSCSDDNLFKKSYFEEEELSKANLKLDISPLSVLKATRGEIVDFTDEDKIGSAAERKIEDLWLFQFKADGSALLCKPRYYKIADGADLEKVGIDVLLALDVESVVYVVANTHSDSWMKGGGQMTLEKLKTSYIPNDPSIYVKVDPEKGLTKSIPMEGMQNVTLASTSDKPSVTVPVTRMLAKMEITLDDVPETLKITAIEVQNIPSVCRVGTLWKEGDDAGITRADYPDGAVFSTDTFKPGEKNENDKYTKKYVIYIPENLQGQNDLGENEKGDKTVKQIENSLVVKFHAIQIDPFTNVEEGQERVYSFCPGANEWNDYNIRRNYIYKVRLHLYTDKYEHEIPSSNCFVVKPGQRLSFLPYYRTEKGGGYDFADYLNPDGSDENKMIDRVSIIWQTPDAIGDNTKGDLVYIDKSPAPFNAEQERLRKIYVKANKIGNALIAAYNKKGEIIWSWHIWIADHDPANVISAFVYTTYPWDESGIHAPTRVPGYAIMRCNLGALRNEPTAGIIEDRSTNDEVYEQSRATFGMLYQWGRKDPFPPLRGGNVSDFYTKKYVTPLRDNANEDKITFSQNFGEEATFQNARTADIIDNRGIEPKQYTINNPTHFMVTTNRVYTIGNPINGSSGYETLNGDWMNGKKAGKGETGNYKHDNKLWGGSDPGTAKKVWKYPSRNFNLFDTYGSEKTIFDPCPAGWRVPPGDLWIGFSINGYSTDKLDFINYRADGSTVAGMYMYMQGFRQGEVSYFPCQGLRGGSGDIMRSKSCGNYHNATTDFNDQVNILHIHYAAGTFKIFEYDHYGYTRKSVGGPVRCVRDHK